MAFTFNSRTLDYRSANIKVKYRDTDGIVKTAGPTELDASSGALRTTLLTKAGVAATTTKARKTGYSKNGSQQVLDTGGGVYVNTWTGGTQPAYTTVLTNTNFLADTTA